VPPDPVTAPVEHAGVEIVRHGGPGIAGLSLSAFLAVQTQADPSYRAPAHVRPIQVTDQWTPYVGAPSAEATEHPFNFQISIQNANGTALCTPSGKSACAIGAAVFNTTPTTVRFSTPLTLLLQVRLSTAPDALVWSVQLPPLAGSVTPDHGERITLPWRDQDALGQTLPSGTYGLSLVKPISIAYAPGS
jgi:hypothetical protein